VILQIFHINALDCFCSGIQEKDLGQIQSVRMLENLALLKVARPSDALCATDLLAANLA
jgi:hypothetical protein